MIRKATASDIPAMVDVIRWGAERSIEAGRLTFDDGGVRRLLFQCVSKLASAWVGVIETDGKVEGLLVGMIQPVYAVAIEQEATDLFWIRTDRGSVRDWVALMVAFVAWAEKHGKVARIQCGVTRILDDKEAASRVLAQIGFTPFGTIYRREA